jgi:hypothetical protein
MKRRTPILLGLLLILLVLVTSILIRHSFEHPILLKYFTFGARSIGSPVQASVYTDGKLNSSISVFSTDQYLLLYFNDTTQTERVICVHQNYVGTPEGASTRDYDYFWGRLFQSEVGGVFVPFDDAMKRSYPFDPKLIRKRNEISFIISPKEKGFRFRSVRIRMNSNS